MCTDGEFYVQKLTMLFFRRLSDNYKQILAEILT